MSEANRAAWPGLTALESRVAELLALGATRDEIADLLGRGLTAIDTHRAHILEKLGLRSTVALARYALRHDLVDDQVGPYDIGRSAHAVAAEERASRRRGERLPARGIRPLAGETRS